MAPVSVSSTRFGLQGGRGNRRAIATPSRTPWALSHLGGSGSGPGVDRFYSFAAPRPLQNNRSVPSRGSTVTRLRPRVCAPPHSANPRSRSGPVGGLYFIRAKAARKLPTVCFRTKLLQWHINCLIFVSRYQLPTGQEPEIKPLGPLPAGPMDRCYAASLHSHH